MMWYQKYLNREKVCDILAQPQQCMKNEIKAKEEILYAQLNVGAEIFVYIAEFKSQLQVQIFGLQSVKSRFAVLNEWTPRSTHLLNVSKLPEFTVEFHLCDSPWTNTEVFLFLSHSLFF